MQQGPIFVLHSQHKLFCIKFILLNPVWVCYYGCMSVKFSQLKSIQLHSKGGNLVVIGLISLSLWIGNAQWRIWHLKKVTNHVHQTDLTWFLLKCSILHTMAFSTWQGEKTGKDLVWQRRKKSSVVWDTIDFLTLNQILDLSLIFVAWQDSGNERTEFCWHKFTG